jgi:ATP-binding cassette subfamily B protein
VIGKAPLGQTIQTALRLDRAVRLVWASAPGWTLANLALMLVQGLFPLATLYLMKQIVDRVTMGVVTHDPVATFQKVAFWIILAGGVALLSLLFSALTGLVGEVQGQLVTDHVTNLLHTQSIAVDLEYYENPRYYDTLHRAQQEAVSRPMQIVTCLVQIGQNGISLIGIAALLLTFNWLGGLALIAAALPAALVRLAHVRKRYGFEQKHTETERQAGYYRLLMTSRLYAKDIRLLDIGHFFQERYRTLRWSLLKGRRELARRRIIADLLVQVTTSVMIFGAFGFVAYQAVSGTFTLGGMVMYYQGLQRSFRAIQAILRELSNLYEHNLFLNNFYQFLDITPKIKAPADPLPVPADIREGLSFEGVSFSYPGGSRTVLQGIDLKLAPGEVIALVGENGSGKTTLVKLLARLYDPDGGKITLDGIDLRRMDPARWRREISVIFQDYAQYNLSVQENIWLGDVERAPESESIVRAAVRSGVDPVIRSLPQGYDTVLGRQFQNGEELSVGEWQKVALARAFLRDARIVVLDEPTSSLDPLAEARLMEQFRRLIEGRSAIIISHRLSTVRMADRICVMDGGMIVEQGTHHELLRQNGRYALLYRTQAEGYRGAATEDLPSAGGGMTAGEFP